MGNDGRQTAGTHFALTTPEVRAKEKRAFAAARCNAHLLPLLLAAASLACATRAGGPTPSADRTAAERRVIVLVWDGLRPDSITRAETPNLYALRDEGVEFADHHSTYPTFTMMNAASLATGSRPGRHGFFGNNVFLPGPDGTTTDGKPVRFSRDVVFTEDLGILRSLDRNLGGKLLTVPTLFEAAHRAGLVTAAVGKAGPAALMDVHGLGMLIDESAILPNDLAAAVQASADVKWPLGKSATGPLVTLPDGVTPDPSAPASRHTRANRALLQAYLDHVLPRRPRLSVIWLRDPDSTEHVYGPGSPAFHDALAHQDELLGVLRDRLAREGLAGSTDLLVMSDHGHSTISAPPRRGSTPAGDAPFGPGELRLAALLTQAGIPAYDTLGCMLSPVLAGERVQVDVARCPGPFTTPAFRLPEPPPASAVVVAANGGSDYLYVPDRDRATVARVVRAVQARPEVDAVFVASAHGQLPGTLPLTAIGLEDTTGRRPDVVVAYAGDETARIRGFPGVEYAGAVATARYRGMHGAMSPSDIHATLVASGPSFKRRFRDPLPTGNVDVAPTVAALLELRLDGVDGRVLSEALTDGADPAAYAVSTRAVPSTPPVPGGGAPFAFELRQKVLRRGGAEFVYDDQVRRLAP